MRTTKMAYRPVLNDRLEDRTVPTGFGFGGFSSVTAQDAVAVSKAFGGFEQNYANDVRTILYAPGTTNPSANTTAFQTKVATDLGTLNTSIDAAIANLPDAATLGATIQAELLGPASGMTTTLQSQIDALTIPTQTGRRAESNLINQGFRATDQTAGQVIKQVRTASPPTGTIAPSTVQTLLGSINTAYRTFSTAYFNDVKTPPTGGLTGALPGLLNTLSGSINSAVTAANLPSSVSSSLTTTLTNDILTSGTATTSLQSRLSALTPPTKTTGFGVIVFDFRSLLIIGGSQGQVNHDVISAINTYNASL